MDQTSSLVRNAGFTLVESVLSLSVLALAGVVSITCLIRSSPARDRSLALRHAPSAIAALAREPLSEASVLLRNKEGNWQLVPESSELLSDYHDLRYRVTIEQHGRYQVAFLQWAPGGEGSDAVDGRNPQWTRLGTVILNRPGQ